MSKSFLQAFVNIVLTLCDAGDSVVMFAPYYFNAYMSFQMTGVTNILVGPGDPETLHPDTGEKVNSMLNKVLQTVQLLKMDISANDFLINFCVMVECLIYLHGLSFT